MTLNEEERTMIQSVLDDPSMINVLGLAFCWKKSPDGYKYWLNQWRKDSLAPNAAKKLRGYLSECA